MDDEGELIAQLTRLGLTSYEAKAYLALMRRDSFTAAQVARQSGVPRQRIYDVLAGLVQKGLAAARPGTVVKYAAAAPELAVDRLVQAHRRELAQVEADAQAMIRSLGPAYEAGQAQTDPLEYIELLRDRRAITERFGELETSVRHEMLVFSRPPYLPAQVEGEAGPAAAAVGRRRSMYELNALDDAAATDAVRRSIEAGEDARFVPELPLALAIVDETTVMLGMADPVAGGGDLTIMVVEHGSLAKLLKTAFEAVWEGGLTFEQARESRTRTEAEASPAS